MMWAELKLIQQVNIAQTYNKIIFYLQKIPIIGKKIPNRFYNAKNFKNVITIIGAIGYFLSQILTKALYFGVLFILSLAISGAGATNAQELSTVFLTLLFFFSMIGGTFFKIKRIDPGDLADILFIKQLNLEEKKYYHAQMILIYGTFFITYSLTLGITLFLIGESVIHALFFSILLISLRLLVQVFYIYSYRPNKTSPEKLYNILTVLSIIIGLLLAILYLNGLIQPQLPNFFHWGSMLAGLTLMSVTIPVLKNTEKYDYIVRTALTSEKIQETQAFIKNAQVTEVQLKEDDLTEDKVVQVESDAAGITFINEVFFARLGHLLKKRIRISGIVLSILFLVVIGILIGVDYFQVAEITSAQVENVFAGPWHIMIIYISSLAYIGEYFTKFCFYNMDRMLMKNNYYRKPEYLLESIWIRFKIAIRYNLPIFILISAGTALVYFIAGGQSFSILFLALLSTFVMMIFFSLHFLFLYYLIQPYTENMENKSPIYAIATFLTFYAPYILLQSTDTLSQSIVLIIYGFGILYLIVGLLAVAKLAPKRFKLR